VTDGFCPPVPKEQFIKPRPHANGVGPVKEEKFSFQIPGQRPKKIPESTAPVVLSDIYTVA
jgi:hypothetical protein